MTRWAAFCNVWVFIGMVASGRWKPTVSERQKIARLTGGSVVFADVAFYCQECGRKFRSVKAAEKAAEKAANDGCPKCGGVDIDEGKPDIGAVVHQ